MAEPQKCPSCGGPPIDETDPNDLVQEFKVCCDEPLWQCECECGLAGPTCKSRAGAIAQWNMLSMSSADAKAHTLRSLFIATSALKSAGFVLVDPAPFDVQKAYDIIETALVRLGVAVQPKGGE